MTEDTTNNYKITAQIFVEVFPYIDADEEIPEYFCYETLQKCKEDILVQLAAIKHRIDKLTMKDIRKGVRW